MSDLVIAIDDTGDFRAGSPIDNFYVAAVVRPSKEEQFARWERGIDSTCRKDGEIKGGLLNDDNRLHDFVREVICAEPRVMITRFAIRPNMHPPGVIASHQASSARHARESAAQLTASGAVDRAAHASGFARWIERMKAAQFLKLTTQVRCVAEAFLDAVGHAATGDYAESLRACGTRSTRAYWETTLRNDATGAQRSRCSCAVCSPDLSFPILG